MTTIVTLSGSPVTASTIINRAFRIVTSTSELPNGTETSNALDSLNSLLDSWRNEKLMCWANQQEYLNLVANQSSYSIGPAGDLNTIRPVRIDSAYVVYQNVSFPVVLYTAEQYNSIPYKAQTAPFPTMLYYAPSEPLGTIYPYPVCNAAGAVLYVNTWTPFANFDTTSTTAYLPPGWTEALCTSLAIKMAPEYQKNCTPDMIQQAKEAKANIKRANNKTPVMSFDGTLLNSRYYNWRIGVS